NLVVAVLGDPVATSQLASGLALGYALTSLSDRRTNQVYSAFWHRHRSALRMALRRTPAPEVAIDASAAPML
ncbi:MAG: hypothetical protein ACRD3C_19690, partial [Vicinamibacterales bacterium]